MSPRGQVLVIVAVLVSVSLLLLAVAVDAGRLVVEWARMQRGAQSAADAGISVVAERMVTLAVARQTEAAKTPSPPAPTPSSPTPDLGDAAAWLTAEDRSMLVSEAVRAQAEQVARDFAHRNGLQPGGAENLELRVLYPQPGYSHHDPSVGSLRIVVVVSKRATVLLAGLLARDFVHLEAKGMSEVPQR